MPLHTDKLIQKEINKHNYMNNRTLLFVVAASLGCVNAVAGNVYDGTNDDKDISKSINLNPVVVTGNGHHQLLKSTTTPLPFFPSSTMRSPCLISNETGSQTEMPS